MTDNKRKKGLGRGLSALLGEDAPGAAGLAPAGVQRAPIEMIRPNPNQPRRTFPPEELEELAASIREKGVLQPLLVRPDPDRPGGYQIIAGERRWRAAQAARLHEAPVIVREMDDGEVLEVAIIENVQRADLNPVEEAAGYAQLIERYGHTQGRVAEIVGKSRPHVANALRLLKLPEEVRAHLVAGRLSAGHARALLTADDPAALARRIVAEGLSVRQAEALAKSPAPARPRAPKDEAAAKDADTRVLEADLSAATGLKISIEHQPDGKGVMKIAYGDLDQLDGLCQLLSR